MRVVPLVLSAIAPLAFASSLTAQTAAASAQTADTQPAAIDTALSRVSPSLVRIHVVSIDHQDGREIKREAAGSGTIISVDGHVLTNHHVAGRTRAILRSLSTRAQTPP